MCFFSIQTQETPLHYAARSGNDDVMLEMVKHIGPNHIQNAINRQAKVNNLQTEKRVTSNTDAEVNLNFSDHFIEIDIMSLV